MEVSSVPQVRWTYMSEGVDGLGADDEHVYVASPEELVALDADDGTVVWSAEIDDLNNWALVTVEGSNVVVTFPEDYSQAFSRETGEPVGDATEATPAQRRVRREQFHMGANETQAMRSAGVEVGDLFSAKVVGRYLFVVDDDHGLRIYDVNSDEQVLVIDPTDEVLFDPSAIIVADGYVLAGLVDGSLLRIDL